jgi:protein TonB
MNSVSASDDAPAPVPGPTDTIAPAKERLTTTLFLAALFHGIIIIGVSFAIPSPLKEQAAPTLEVVLLAQDGPTGADRPDAKYLAQRNQEGSGTTQDPVKASAPPSSDLTASQEGLAEGNGAEYRDATSGAPAQDLLRARSEHAENTDSGATTAATSDETPIALAPTAPSSVVTTSAEESLRMQGPASRSLLITPDTRAAKIAPYLGAWKRKIERIGTINYPSEARRRHLSGSPVLEVTIRSDGSLASINVRRSSGHKEIDQAALAILRLAAPFDPFPAALKRDYDELRFAYEWQFAGDGVNGGSLTVDRANAGTKSR